MRQPEYSFFVFIFTLCVCCGWRGSLGEEREAKDRGEAEVPGGSQKHYIVAGACFQLRLEKPSAPFTSVLTSLAYSSRST
jgi:hypothetical protein